MQLIAVLAPESAGLVVVGRSRFERRVGVADELLILAQRQHLFISYPLMLEDGSLVDGVVHHLLLPGPVAHEVGILLSLLFGPFLFPYRIALIIHRADLRDMDPTGGSYVGQYRVLADEVAHHDEAATSHIQGTEQCLLDPIGEFPDTPLITAEFIVIEVIDNDVVGSCFTFTQTTRRLPPAHSQELHAVSCGELTFHPVAERHLFAEIGDDALVVLELCLDVTQETIGTVL